MTESQGADRRDFMLSPTFGVFRIIKRIPNDSLYPKFYDAGVLTFD